MTGAQIFFLFVLPLLITAVAGLIVHFDPLAHLGDRHRHHPGE